jgi:hypothetical protein
MTQFEFAVAGIRQVVGNGFSPKSCEEFSLASIIAKAKDIGAEQGRPALGQKLFTDGFATGSFFGHIKNVPRKSPQRLGHCIENKIPHRIISQASSVFTPPQKGEFAAIP